MSTILIAVVSSEQGFKKFGYDFIYGDGSNQLNDIKFIRISEPNDLRGHHFHSYIIHYSCRDIREPNYSEILERIPSRCIPITDPYV